MPVRQPMFMIYYPELEDIRNSWQNLIQSKLNNAISKFILNNDKSK